MDYHDMGWGRELGEQQKPLLDAQKVEQISALLKDRFMMGATEIRDTIEIIQGSAGMHRANASMVVIDALPGKMKHSFRVQAASEIAVIVQSAVDARNAVSAGGPAAAVSQTTAPPTPPKMGR